MVSMKILIILLIFVCVAFFVLYVGDFSLVLLITVIALPIVMFIMLLSVKLRSRVNIILSSDTASKKEVFDITLCVDNKSMIPVGKAVAVVDYYNVFNDEINSFELSFPILPRNSQKITLQISSAFCGLLKINCAFIEIYDPMRIFRMKIGKNTGKSIVIMPNCDDIYGIVSDIKYGNDESTVFSPDYPGDDPSEVFDLRDYVPGDKLNRIHWKLSSKSRDLIVKEYSYPIDSDSVIFLDLSFTDDSEYVLPLYDTLVELFTSLSRLLISNGRFCTLVYYNYAEKGFARRTIDSAENLGTVIKEIFLSFSDDLYMEPFENYFSDTEFLKTSSFTLVTAEFDEKLMQRIDKSVFADIINIFVAVKTSDDARKFSGSYSDINIMPVVAGRINSIEKSFEI